MIRSKVIEVKKPYKSKVVFFNIGLGYGFIEGLNGDKDYFVHHTNLIERIKKDDIVLFNLIDSTKGLIAVDVEVCKN